MSLCNGVNNVTRDIPCDTLTTRKYVPRRVLEASNEASNEEVFLRKLKCIFNKMCGKTAEAQYGQVIETLEEIKKNNLSSQTWIDVSKLILQRAIAEPNCHQMYLGLCSKIGGEFNGILIPKENGEKEKEREKGLKFGDLFPIAYDSELQQRLSIKDIDDDLLERMKEKMLSATRFLGELGKRISLFTTPANLLPPVNQLLAFLGDPSFQGDFAGMPSLRVECACTLLTLIGKTVDMNPNDQTENIFGIIERLGENKSLVPRLRFMAKGLHELRSHRWLPRILTKKDDPPTNGHSTNSSSSSSASNSSNSSNSMNLPLSSSSPLKISRVSPAREEKEKEKENGGEKEMSMEDAQLFSAMDNFVQKLDGKSSTCAYTALRKFTKSISSDQLKMLASILSENSDLLSSLSSSPPSSSLSSSPSSTSQLSSSPSKDKPVFPMRRGSTSFSPKSPASPLALSRNFHAIINLIKLNTSSSLSDEVNQSLVTKISTLKPSELIEVVGSIFRKMCEMPEEYSYCLNICLHLSSNAKTAPHTFQETLETCCQDETALRMFNTQASIDTYLKLVGDLERELGMDVQVVKRCVGNVQNGLYELTDQEASLLSHLESIIMSQTHSSPSSISSLSSPSVSSPVPSPSPFTTSSLSPPPPAPLSPPPLLQEIELRREQKNYKEEQEVKEKEIKSSSKENISTHARGRGGEGHMWS